MAIEEKILSDDEKAELMKDSSLNQEEVEYGRIVTVSSVKIMRSDKDFFEETARTIPEVKKCIEKVKPEKQKIKSKISEIKKQLDEAKNKQKQDAKAKADALRALSGRPTKLNEGKPKQEEDKELQPQAEQSGSQIEIERLEKDLVFCKGADKFIDDCGADASRGLTKLENIMSTGKVENWSVLVDFAVIDLPSENAKNKEAEKEKNNEKEDKEKDDNENNGGGGSGKGKNKNKGAHSEKGFKNKLDKMRGISNSKRSAVKDKAGVDHEVGKAAVPQELNPQMLQYLNNQKNVKS